ncbi:hypothetical protein EON65_17775 [archaeon]|nr:MAG: hypothetical protein EON65_17775 [archaeon]
MVECKVCKKAVQKDVLPSTPLDRAKERMLVEHSSRNSVDGLRLLDVTTPGPKSAAANAPSSSTLLTPYLKATANKHTGQAQPTSKIPSSSNSTQPQKFSFLSSVKSLARPSMLPGKSAAPLMSQVDRRQSAPGNLMNSSMQPSSMMSAVLSGTKRPGEDAPTMPNLLEIERMNKKKKKRLSEGGDS